MEKETDRSAWDVVVIGAGPPGENAAQYAIQSSGLSAVLIENELVGGECSYWACMPSKALLRPVEVVAAARHLPGLERLAERPDVSPVLGRRDEFTHHRDDSSQVQWAEGAGISVLRGHGRLAGERTVEVTEPGGSVRTVEARHAVVLATGTSAAIPPVEGLASALPWTSRDVTNLVEVPRRVLIVGGGVVACEAATWLLGLGASEVTLVEGGPRLLGRNEDFAGELVAASLAESGARVVCGQSVVGVSRGEPSPTGTGRVHGGPVTVRLSDGSVIEADEILVAAGRKPNSGNLGLESVGASPDSRGFVRVDEHMTVPGIDWLYAVGDLCGRALLTHMGKYQARIAGDVIAARAAGRSPDGLRYRDVADDGIVPQVTFTDPEVASVGRTSAEASAAGFDVETVDWDMASLAGTSLLRDGYVGRARLVIDRKDDVVLGATFVGAEVAELVHSATVAIVGRVPVEVLWHAVPSYPTVSEVWLRLLETLRQQRSG